MLLIGATVLLAVGVSGGTASAASGATAVADTSGIVGCANPVHRDSAVYPGKFRFWTCADGDPQAENQLSQAVAVADNSTLR
jgi:hypothetical protein